MLRKSSLCFVADIAGVWTEGETVVRRVVGISSRADFLLLTGGFAVVVRKPLPSYKRQSLELREEIPSRRRAVVARNPLWQKKSFLEFTLDMFWEDVSSQDIPRCE